MKLDPSKPDGTAKPCIITACLLLLAATQAAPAGTILQVTGPADAVGITSPQTFAVGAAFSTLVPFTNVSVYVPVTAIVPITTDLHVYLTNQVGAGTTVGANEIGSVSLNVAIPPGLTPPYLITEFPVLTGLSLPAGTYYLTFQFTNVVGGGFPFSLASTITDAVIVTNGTSLLDGNIVAGPLDPYVPASGFHHNTLGPPFYDIWFRITGDVASAPEPTTAAGVAGAFLLLRLIAARCRDAGLSR
jgi:hypothetical protein